MRSRNLLQWFALVVLLLLIWVPTGLPQAVIESGSNPAAILDFAFSGANDQTVVLLTADRIIDYASYYPNPRLFILDIPGAHSKLKKNFVSLKTTAVDFATISQIGEGQKALTRIEFNLNLPIQYSLQAEGAKVRLVFSTNITGSSEPANELSRKQKPVKPGAASQPSAIRDVAIQENEDQVEFTLLTTAKPVFKHFELQKPQRLVVDVDNSTFKVARKALPINSELIQRLRFGQGESQQGKLVRCVFDLSRKASYEIMATEEGLVVRFHKSDLARTALQTPPLVQPAAEAKADWPPAIADAGDPVSLALNAVPLLPSMLTDVRALVMPPPLAAPPAIPGASEMEPLPQFAMNNLRPGIGVFESSLNLAQPTAAARPEAPLVEERKLETVPPSDGELLKSEPPHLAVDQLPQAIKPVVVAQLNPPPPALLVRSVAPKPLPPPASAATEESKLTPDEPKTVAIVSQQSAPPVQPTPAPAVPAAPSVSPPSSSQVMGQVISQVTSTVPPKYTGELISLELKDADLKDFFRLIGEISGLNIVLDPDVKGALTIFLTDVPWDQALDVVLKNNSLGKQLEGNVLRIAANKTLEDEEAQRKRLTDARVVAAELQTETRVLSYAKAADLSIVLKKVLSPRGDIIVDARTNSMIISDIPGKFPAIDALIKQLDKKIKQVEIEARVIAGTRDFVRDIGIQWGAIMGNNSQNRVAGALPGNPFARSPAPNVTIPPTSGSGGASNSVPLNVNLPANAPTSSLFATVGFTTNFILDTLITAAERSGTAKLLSKPKIITQDNIEGFVQQGVKIPVQTTINNTVSVQFFDFALKLKVTPQITDEGTIMLNVDIENSTPDFSRQVMGVPTVNTQQTKTTVLINSGGTVVVGGVLIDNEQTNVRQVPGFGSIPLIGNLFKQRSITKQTQELIFFLSPRIL